MTRAFDVFLAGSALILLAPLMLLLALLIRLDSPGGALFRQRRVGWRGREFTIYKFRTMVMGASKLGSSVTTARDPRVTRLGALLRRGKLDELPQLFNVIRGDMALVGPRPEVPEVVALYDDEMREVFEMRPGITSLTSLDLADEEGLLAAAADPDDFYLRILLPAKVADSIRRSTPGDLLSTLRVLNATATAGFRRLLGRPSQSSLMATLRRHPDLIATPVPSDIFPANYPITPLASRSAVDSTTAKEAT